MGGFKKQAKPSIDYDALARARAEEERKKELERQSRGTEGTIKTSYTGVLGVKEDNLKRKNLLGE
ncbi:MAG: hypothetical protein LBL47_03070 [Lactobacillus sp.]|jgi:hypothetical protein|nr:hypothetical protein [Lactobacillus sp.]